MADRLSHCCSRATGSRKADRTGSEDARKASAGKQQPIESGQIMIVSDPDEAVQGEMGGAAQEADGISPNEIWTVRTPYRKDSSSVGA